MADSGYMVKPPHALNYDGLKRTVAATAMPVSVDEAKEHCRIVGSDSDADLERLIWAATEVIEKESKRQLCTATWVMKLDEFPASDAEPIRIPRPPLASITSIQYVDLDGDTQTWSSGDYVVDTFNEPARVTPAYLESYPDTRSQINAVTITFQAGYGGTTSVPYDAKLAVLSLVAHWFENREPVNVGNIVTSVPRHLDDLIAKITVPEMR